MTHTLAMEWAQHGIRVNSVSPGLVNTAMTYWVPQQPDWEQQLKYYGGFSRLAEVQELGGAYVYLLSDAASYTTSIDIPVNGVIGSKFLTGVDLIDLIRDADLYSLLIGVPLGESCVGSNPSLYAEDRNKRRSFCPRPTVIRFMWTDQGVVGLLSFLLRSLLRGPLPATLSVQAMNRHHLIY